MVKDFDNLNFKIEGQFTLLKQLSRYLSVRPTGFQFSPKYKLGVWDGFINFFNMSQGLLPIGLINELIEFAKVHDEKLKFEIDESKYYNDSSEAEILEHTKDFFKPGFVLRDYQQDAIIKCIRNKRGVCKSATGSGKSAMIYFLFRYFIDVLNKKKTLLIVPNTSLVEQMYSDFKDYGYTNIHKYVTKLYSGQDTDFDKPILISTWQSLQNLPIQFFKNYDAIVVDETQHAKSTQIQKIAKACQKADYRLGFTGTVPKEKVDAYNIYSVLGPVIFELQSKTLIKEGTLSKITIANIILEYPKSKRQVYSRAKYQEEMKFVETFEKRNYAFSFIYEHINKKHNTLVILNKLDHLASVKNYLENTCMKKVFVISGEVNTKTREEIRTRVNTSEGITVLATYGTMAAGVNIPKLHHVILASSSKSEIRVLQTIGRGLRKHKEKEEVIIWDIVDNLTYVANSGNKYVNYTVKHWQERMKFYKQEGFKTFNQKIEL